jgi:hypothetical protein
MCSHYGIRNEENKYDEPNHYTETLVLIETENTKSNIIRKGHKKKQRKEKTY